MDYIIFSVIAFRSLAVSIYIGVIENFAGYVKDSDDRDLRVCHSFQPDDILDRDNENGVRLLTPPICDTSRPLRCETFHTLS